MTKTLQHIVSISLLITNLFLLSCNQSDEPLVYNPELVFPNAFKIDVDPYNYSSSDDPPVVYWIQGDASGDIDTVDGTPVFEWTPVLANLVTVAVSTEAFVVVDGQIKNTKNIIWQWHPGMTEGERGKVNFLEGKPVKNEVILYDTQPIPLESGLYYWAVWSWEDSGRQIFHSTKPNRIYVE
jgi:hypothetical protein